MTTVNDFDTEIETLTSTLKVTADKINLWTDDEHSQLALSIAKQQDGFLKSSIEEKEKLKMKMANMKLEKDKVLEEKHADMKKLKAELENQYKLAQDLNEQKVKCETEVGELKKHGQKLKEEIDSTAQAKQKLEYLSRANSIFSNMLGLSFRKTKGNKLQVIFTQIDEKDPQMAYYFFLQIVNGKYIVSDPEPQIEGIEELVGHLNETNNLRQFVIKTRLKFKELVNS